MLREALKHTLLFFILISSSVAFSLNSFQSIDLDNKGPSRVNVGFQECFARHFMADPSPYFVSLYFLKCNYCLGDNKT